MPRSLARAARWGPARCPHPASGGNPVDSDPVRLLEITNDFPPTLGGIENYIYSLVARWEPGQVAVVTRAGEGAAAVDAGLAGATVHREPGATLLPTGRLAARVRALLAEQTFDVVHFASPLPLALLGPRILAETGVPYAVSVHGGEFIAGIRLLRPLMLRALAGAAVLLPVSSWTEQAILRLLPNPPPTEVVTPGVDEAQFAPMGPLDPAMTTDGGGRVILTACRLVARKGPATLISALPAILQRHPRTVLVIAGEGPDRPRLERLAQQQGVAASVRFLGPRPWSRIGDAYRGADIFALATRERFGGLETEGFPLVYLEAAAAGLPVVAGSAGGVREAVVDGRTGIIVDGASVADTAAALLALLDNPTLATRMGANGRDRVLTGFTWDMAAERFRTALEKYC